MQDDISGNALLARGVGAPAAQDLKQGFVGGGSAVAGALVVVGRRLRSLLAAGRRNCTLRWPLSTSRASSVSCSAPCSLRSTCTRPAAASCREAFPGAFIKIAATPRRWAGGHVPIAHFVVCLAAQQVDQVADAERMRCGKWRTALCAARVPSQSSGGSAQTSRLPQGTRCSPK